MVSIAYNRSDEDADARAADCYEALFARSLELGGQPSRLPLFAMSEGIAKLRSNDDVFLARIRDAIDPQGLIARGRYACRDQK